MQPPGIAAAMYVCVCVYLDKRIVGDALTSDTQPAGLTQIRTHTCRIILSAHPKSPYLHGSRFARAWKLCARQRRRTRAHASVCVLLTRPQKKFVDARGRNCYSTGERRPTWRVARGPWTATPHYKLDSSRPAVECDCNNSRGTKTRVCGSVLDHHQHTPLGERKENHFVLLTAIAARLHCGIERPARQQRLSLANRRISVVGTMGGRRKLVQFMKCKLSLETH